MSGATKPPSWHPSPEAEAGANADLEAEAALVAGSGLAATRARTRLNAVVADFAERNAPPPCPAAGCLAEAERVRALLRAEERAPGGEGLAAVMRLALDVAEMALAWGSDEQVREAARVLRGFGR